MTVARSSATDALAAAAADRPIPEPAPPGSGGWLRRLWPFLMAHKRNVIIAFGMAIAGQAVAGFVPVIERAVIDDGIVAQTRPVWPFLLLLLAAGAFSFLSSYIRRWVGGRVSLDVQYDLRVAIFERLQRLDFAGHDDLQTGQLVSRSSSDLALIQGLLAFLPIIVGNFVMLARVARRDGLPVARCSRWSWSRSCPALLLVSMRMRESIFPATWDAQQKAGEVAGVVDEAVTGVRVVKGFGQEERELGASRRRGRDALRARGAGWSGCRPGSRRRCRPSPAFGQVAVLALGGWLALEGHITLGTFLAFSSYLVQLVAPVRMLAGLFAIGQQARAGCRTHPRRARRQRVGARRTGQRDATHRCAATSGSKGCGSATRRARRCSTTSTCTSSRARWSRSSGPADRASPRSPRCCPASTTWPRVG